MVFNSFDSRSDQFEKLSKFSDDALLREYNAAQRQGQLSKAKLKAKLPKLSDTRTTDGQPDLIVDEIFTTLNALMKPDDARDAFEYLSANGLLATFQNQQERFLKYFKGVKKIPINAFKKYFETSERIAEEEPILSETQMVNAPKTTVIDAYQLFDDAPMAAIAFMKQITSPEHISIIFDAIKNAGFDITAKETVKRGDVEVLKSAGALATARRNAIIEWLKSVAAYTEGAKPIVSSIIGMSKAFKQTVATVATGSGLRLGARHASIANRYHPVGEKYIHSGRLHEGYLSLYHPSKRIIGRSHPISKKLVDLIKQIVHEERFDQPAIDALDKGEREIFDHFVQTTKVHLNPKYGMHSAAESDADLYNRYQLLIGAIAVGNDNRHLIEELKTLIGVMYKRGMVEQDDLKLALEKLYV